MKSLTHGSWHYVIPNSFFLTCFLIFDWLFRFLFLLNEQCSALYAYILHDLCNNFSLFSISFACCCFLNFAELWALVITYITNAYAISVFWCKTSYLIFHYFFSNLRHANRNYNFSLFGENLCKTVAFALFIRKTVGILYISCRIHKYSF